MFEKISQFLVPIAGRLNNNRYLQVLRDAFMLAFPLTIFGSIFVVLTNLPFLNKIMNASMLTSFQSHFGIASTATMGIMSVFVVFGIGYYLSKSYQVEAVFGGAIALVSFLLLTPFIVQPETGDAVTGVIPVDRLGAKGMFLGMITAFLSGEIYRRIVQKNLTIKMPAGVPPAVAKSFAALIPAFITLTVFLLINVMVTLFFKTRYLSRDSGSACRTWKRYHSNADCRVFHTNSLVFRTAWTDHYQLRDGPDLEYTAGRKPFCLHGGKRNPSYYFKTVYGDLYSRDGRNRDDACDCVYHSHKHEKQADEASIKTWPRSRYF